MKIDILAGARDFLRLSEAAPWRPFDERTIDFLAAFSDRLRRHPLANAHIDLMGLVFFCRRTHVEDLRRRHSDRCNSAVGRGLSFHIAPSNVPINFAYSLVLGLLSGNTCIVRASSKDFPETTIVSSTLADLLSEARFAEFNDRISVVRYERDKQINDYLSSLCDVRLIWGGDSTIAELRKSPIAPRAIDFLFADRYSLCVVEASGYLKSSEKHAIAIGFYNDTYRNQQAACTAPRLLYWLGNQERVESAQKVFWNELDDILVAKGEESSAIEAVEKFTASCRLALTMPSARTARPSSMRITRMAVSALDDSITQAVCNGGFFVEYRSDTLDALRRFVTSKFQTVTYIGMSAELIAREVAFAGVKGIDRIVSNGRASEFDLYWDGYDLMANLTRYVVVA